jgi:hypothetical protein
MTANFSSKPMNARFVKHISLLLLLPLLSFAQFVAHAQGATGGEIPLPPGYGTNAKANATANTNPRYEIEIANGSLLLAPLKGRTNINAIWGPGDLHSVSATIENLAKYLRAANPNLNIVLSPGTAEETISDLKLRTDDIKAICEAVSIASDGKIRGSSLSGKDNWTFMAQQKGSLETTVEVFNLSGYIQTLDKGEGVPVEKNLDEIRRLIVETLNQIGYKNADNISFRFHPGTHLLIVTGTPETIDVARKFLSALPGQQKPEKELLDLYTPQNQK